MEAQDAYKDIDGRVTCSHCVGAVGGSEFCLMNTEAGKSSSVSCMHYILFHFVTFLLYFSPGSFLLQVINPGSLSHTGYLHC